MIWKDKKTWPAIWSLFASEASHIMVKNRIAELQAKSERSPEEEASLKGLVDSPDKDWDVMNNWISLLKKAGYDFFNDKGILAQREVVLTGLAESATNKSLEQKDAKKIRVYQQIAAVNEFTDKATMQGLIDEAEALKSDQDPEHEAYQKIIADLLASECLWSGK